MGGGGLVERGSVSAQQDEKRKIGKDMWYGQD